ncbi:hypothetical protein EDC94DRAFT_584521 [Helicostylum pulchrum]|nr:hypothetical protein EDC94DRAFT_584521 [Helicostylum pulchrum]
MLTRYRHVTPLRKEVHKMVAWILQQRMEFCHPLSVKSHLVSHKLFKIPALYNFLSSGNENTFNHYVIWPLMDVYIDNIKPNMKLMLAEYDLRTLFDEYARLTGVYLISPKMKFACWRHRAIFFLTRAVKSGTTMSRVHLVL